MAIMSELEFMGDVKGKNTIETICHCGYIWSDNSKRFYYNDSGVKSQAILELHKFMEKCTVNCNECCHVSTINLLFEGVNKVLKD